MAILFVFLIFAFLLREGVPAFWEVKFSVLLGARWYPTEGHFGLWPLILGSLLVTLGAAAISPDLTQAWVPSKQDNIKRGGLRNGSPLTLFAFGQIPDPLAGAVMVILG